MIHNDRTLLWETSGNIYNTTFNLPEPVTHYESIEVYASGKENDAGGIHLSKQTFNTQNAKMACDCFGYSPWTTGYNYVLGSDFTISGTQCYCGSSYYMGMALNSTAYAAGKWVDANAQKMLQPIKIIGINRKPTLHLRIINGDHGTVSASVLTGCEYDTVTLSNTPDEDWYFSGYNITGATLTGNKFTFGNSDVTVEGVWSDQLPTKTLTLNALNGWISANIANDETQQIVTASLNSVTVTAVTGSTVTLLASGKQGTNTASYAMSWNGGAAGTANTLPIDGTSTTANRLSGSYTINDDTELSFNTVQTIKYNCNGYGSTTYPCSMSFSSQYGSYGYRQSGFVPVGGVITETGSCTAGLTYSLYNLNGMNTTSCTWNHKGNGSTVTAKGTVTGVSDDNMITIGNQAGRNKIISAQCMAKPSNNQANCSDYQPRLYINAISSNCHPNNTLNGNTYDKTVTDFYTGYGTTGEMCWGNGTNGWTNYGTCEKKPMVQDNLCGKLITWSAGITVKNITAGTSSPTYWIWGYSTSRSQLNKSTMSRGGTYTNTYTGTTGTKIPFIFENGSTKPMNMSGIMNITGRTP